MLRHLVNCLLWFLPPSRMFRFRRACLRLASIDAGEGSCVCGRGWIFGRGRVRIGDATWLSPGVVVYTHLDAPITIGNRCDIGHAVEFVTGSHAIGDRTRRAGQGTAKPIFVGDGCWIGAKSTILGGVRIGEGAIVAAGSVVIRDVEPNTLVAGVPASVKRALP